MDYFSVIVLVVITFVYINDRRIKSIEYLNSKNPNIIEEITRVKNDITTIKFNLDNISYEKLNELLNSTQTSYIFLQNSSLYLSDERKDLLIANFVSTEKNMCGFNSNYICVNRNKSRYINILLSVINYLNIFNKNELPTYGVIILSKKDIGKITYVKNKKIICKDIISYVEAAEKKLTSEIRVKNKKDFLKLLLKQIYNSSFLLILKFTLFIITGSYITTRLIYSAINIKNNFDAFLISLIIYICYTYIIKYIYEPLGKRRIVASYLFPLYFISYIIAIIYIAIMKNKRVKIS